MANVPSIGLSSDGMAAIRIQHLALGIALAVTSAGCSSWRPPVVVKVARTINNAETISSKDYERLREVTEEAIDPVSYTHLTLPTSG